jgi:hypothetical protein
MSAHQGSSACRITVDPSDADVLRVEAKKVLMFNHEEFEDFLDYVPVKQLELADIFRDATAVIDAVGWDPDVCLHRAGFEIPLTRGHIEQLHNRRKDLLDTNLDLLTDIGADQATNAAVMSDIYANRHSVEASTASSTPTATRSPHRPARARCGVRPRNGVRGVTPA